MMLIHVIRPLVRCHVQLCFILNLTPEIWVKYFICCRFTESKKRSIIKKIYQFKRKKYA